MPLQATSGAASYDAFGGGVAAVPNYIEDVFSTYLYTGTGAAQTITNGIDLSTKGGLVWAKTRDYVSNYALFDTVRGGSSLIISNSSNGAYTGSTYINPFNSNGFTWAAGDNQVNGAGRNYVSWTWRKQPKFFDIQTWSGNSTARTIAHNLGSVPGCIMVKRTDATAQDWNVYHRSLGNEFRMALNGTSAAVNIGNACWNSTTPTSTVFSLGTNSGVNSTGGTYVAYIFAHDAGGFGLTGTDNVISCGSFTTDGSGNASVNLGYEPQFWLYKPNLAARYWEIYDTMRGWSQTQIANLAPNISDAEGGGAATAFYPTATGFDCVGSYLDASTQHIYIAIRRGPMKVPTVGTSVFSPVTRTGTGAAAVVTAPNFVVDSTWIQQRTSGWQAAKIFDRLRGATNLVYSNTTSAEVSDATTLTSFASNVGFTLGDDSNNYSVNRSGEPYINWAFKRAPSFFDEICFDEATAPVSALPHNLTVVPELVIYKKRSSTSNWITFSNVDFNKYLRLNTTDNLTSGVGWAATSSTVNLSSVTGSATAVAYLFATCAGVSKVGSYTGTATTKQIDCGFTAGSRFVLIKRTDSTGDWYVWDSARGIVAGNDPYLLLNSTAAEVTSTDYIDTYSAGFEISSTAPAAINANGGTYIFLAIA